MKRRKSRLIKIGKVKIGDNSPIVVQGMTKTDTEDITATVKQIEKLTKAGAKIVRVAVPTRRAAKAISQIKARVDVPLVADVHFNHRIALECIDQGVDKVRINPGNMEKEEILRVAKRAKEAGIPLRIGVNSGSLEEKFLGENLDKVRGYREEKHREIVAKAMAESALQVVRLLEEENFFDIVVSLKSSDVLTTVLSYELIADKIPYPLHLGITATGPPPQGTIKSSIGMGMLLAQGIGDTLRVSLTADPVEEVRMGYQILKTLHLYEAGPTLISCPTCGRCKVDLKSIVEKVLSKIEEMKSPLTVAIMGCEVNGPGEAKEADIGIACMRGGGVLFKKGKRIKKLKKEEMVKVLLREIKLLVGESING